MKNGVNRLSIYYIKKNEEKFKSLLNFLEKNNVFFKNYSEFNKNELLEDVLSRFPILDKNFIKQTGNIYFSKNNSEVVVELTSGSTGVPFKCYKSREERNHLALALWKERLLRDRLVSYNNFLPLLGKINMTSGIDFADTSANNMRNIINYIKDNNIRWLCGTKSIVTKYADYIRAENIRLASVKFIELQGEQVSEYEVKYLEKCFEAQVIVHYGTREFWTIAYEGQCGKLHVLSDDIICEVEEDEEYGELVLTSTLFKYMPLIRYRTGDYVKISYEKNCTCGKRECLTIDLSGGRKTSFIKDENGINGDLLFKRVVHRSIKECGYDDRVIDRYFVEQTGRREFVFHIQKGKKYCENLQYEICRYTNEFIGGICKVSFIYESINLSLNGKNKIFSVCY